MDEFCYEKCEVSKVLVVNFLVICVHFVWKPRPVGAFNFQDI